MLQLAVPNKSSFSLPMTTHNLGLPMSLFLMIHSVVAGDFLTGFTMMPRSFTGLHVFFRMGGGVAGDVGPADVTVKS